MAKEVWGTFSVNDHKAPGAFLREVMLFDRLVVPVPGSSEEFERWKDQNVDWDPDRQRELLGILGKHRVVEVKWNDERRKSWSTRYEATRAMARETPDYAFALTRSELLKDIPRSVTGTHAIAAFQDVNDLETELNLRHADPADRVAGAAVCILGREFLVPNDPERSETDLLKQAVELSSERQFRLKRRSLWRWTREFLAEQRNVMPGDEATAISDIREAIDEMNELLAEERESARKEKIKVGTQFAFVVASVSVGILAAPLTPLAIAGGFLSVGQFVSDRLLGSRGGAEPGPTALFTDARKHFGWE